MNRSQGTLAHAIKGAAGRFGRRMGVRLIKNIKWMRHRSGVAWDVKLNLAPNGDMVLGNRSRIAGPGILSIAENGSLCLGDNSRLVGFFELVIDSHARLIVGEGVYIGAFANIRCNQRIYIGDRTLMGQFVSLVGGNYAVAGKEQAICEENFAAADILIGENVWIGAGVTVLPGRMIGDGAVVGAGSVVTRHVRPLEIVAGNPLRNLGWRE